MFSRKKAQEQSDYKLPTASEIEAQQNQQREVINREARQRIELFQIDKCFNHCVKSFMEKLFSPYEKECFNVCLQNITAFKIEAFNALEDFN